MNYHMNLGAWRSVFALPCELVDQHLKLAGAAQLKVILWMLRHAGEGFSTADISAALTMQEADVRDCMLYWQQTGLIAVCDDSISPAPAPEASLPAPSPAPAMAASRPQPPAPVAIPAPSPTENDAPAPEEPPKTEKKQRALTRPEKPDLKYLTERVNSDPSVAYMMQTADEIFGRITSNNDKAILLLIHDHDGLPVEVIIMLLQYALSIGKCNMRYIEKMAISWAEEEITTLDAAEQKIRRLTDGRSAARLVQRIIGAEEHSPTESESALADRWVNQWKFSPEMIRTAYEVCVDAKGKFIKNYTNSVLERWYKAGITTPEQVHQEKQSRKKSTKTDSYQATYDISEYESTSVTDGEW